MKKKWSGHKEHTGASNHIKYLNVLLGVNVVTSIIVDYYFKERVVIVCNKTLTVSEVVMLKTIFEMVKIVPGKSGDLVLL